MPSAAAIEPKEQDELLRSWKEIASYLGRSVRTVQRWEKENGLPIHRVTLAQRGAIYASRRELNEWWAARSSILEIEPHETGPSTKAAAPATVPASILPSHRWWRFAVAGVVAAVLLIAGMEIWKGAVERRSTLLTGVPVTTRTGVNLHPALSPDGKQVAFVWGAEGTDIYLQALDADFGRPLTASHRALSAAWAPDGQHVAYLQAPTRQTAELWVSDLGTGRQRQMTEVQYEREAFPRGSLLTWTPDGTSIIVTNRPHPNESAGLFAVSVSNGSMRRLTSPPDPGWRDLCPRLSSDGRVLAFVREQLYSKLQLCYVPWEGGRSDSASVPTCLSLPQVRIYGFSFGSDSQTLFASLANVGLQGQIWKVPLHSPGQAKRLPLADDTTLEPTYAAGRLLYVAGGIRVGLRAYQLSDGQAHDGQMIAASQRIEIDPRLSPDGSRLAFVSNRSGAYDVWVVDSEGKTDPRRVSRLNGETAGNGAWSPDGRELAFNETVGGKTAVYVSALDDKSPRKWTLREQAPYMIRAWSRDGTRLYIESGRQSETTRLVQLDLTNSHERVVATGLRGAALGITPDESAFLEYDAGAGELKRIDGQTGRVSVLARGSWADFYADDSGVLLKNSKTSDQTGCYSRYFYETGRLINIGPCTCDGPGAALSKDGRRLICSAAQVSTELKFATVE